MKKSARESLCVWGIALKAWRRPKSESDRHAEDGQRATLLTNPQLIFVFIATARYPAPRKEKQETIKQQELSHSLPISFNTFKCNLTLSPPLHLMIPNVANSTSIMHAKRRPSLQWLNLTTSRSVDAIAGRCGGREAWTTPPCKGYLRYTDPGAPTSCGVHARRRYSAEKHTKWCMCGDHCQLPSYDNRGQSIRETGGDEGKETEKDFSFSPLFFFFLEHAQLAYR